MTYATLQGDIAQFLQRDDLTATIPTFVRYATAAFNRVLRTPEMESRALTSVGSEFTAVPVDFLEIRAAIDEDGNELRYVAAQQFATVVDRAPLIDAPIYTIEDMQIRVYPVPDTAYDLTILYYQRIPDFVSGTDTNWLLRDSPDAYLYGSLVHARLFLNDDQRVAMVQRMYDAALAEIRRRKVAATGIASAIGSDVPTGRSSFDIARGW